MQPSVLEPLRKMTREELRPFLNRELRLLPIRDRARLTLDAIICLAPDLETWRGSWSEIAAGVVAIHGSPCSKETARRGVDELRESGLVQTSGRNGAACTYTVQWLALLDMRRKPLIEQHEEPATDGPTKPDHLRRTTAHGRSAAAGNVPDRGHLTAVTPANHVQAERGPLTAVTPLTAVNSNRGHPAEALEMRGPDRADRGHPPDRGQALHADAVLKRSHFETAPASHGATARRREPPPPLWGRSIDHAEWRSPDELIPDLFASAIGRGLVKDCDADRIAFAALIVHVAERKGVRNRTGLLTTILLDEKPDRFGRNWRGVATAAQEETARHLLQRIDSAHAPALPRRPDAYTSQLQAANDEVRDREAKIAAARKALLGPCPGGVR